MQHPTSSAHIASESPHQGTPRNLIDFIAPIAALRVCSSSHTANCYLESVPIEICKLCVFHLWCEEISTNWYLQPNLGLFFSSHHWPRISSPSLSVCCGCRIGSPNLTFVGPDRKRDPSHDNIHTHPQVYAHLYSLFAYTCTERRLPAKRTAFVFARFVCVCETTLVFLVNSIFFGVHFGDKSGVSEDR